MGASYIWLLLLFSLALFVSGSFKTLEVSYNNGSNYFHNSNCFVLCKYDGQ